MIGDFYYCSECGVQQPSEDEFDTDNGDVDPRTFHVIALECGHSIDWLVSK
jgi:hypothetical protein